MPAGRMRIALLTTAAVVGIGVGVLLTSRSAPPPVLASVPAFELTSDSGKGFSQASLGGTPWVASFVYTTCPGPCPRLVGRLKKVRRRIPASSVAFVSFSVDPGNDTPEVLAAYKAEHGITDEDRWYFATGPEETVLDVVRKGFLTAVEKGDGSSEQGAVLHGLRVALVDAGGRIRGFYATESDEELARLERDARSLP